MKCLLAVLALVFVCFAQAPSTYILIADFDNNRAYVLEYNGHTYLIVKGPSSEAGLCIIHEAACEKRDNENTQRKASVADPEKGSWFK